MDEASSDDEDSLCWRFYDEGFSKISQNMRWTVHMNGGPQRVNHAAATIGTNIFTFGGYCSGVDYNIFRPIETHVLDTVKLKWLKPELLKDQDPDCVPFERYGHTAVVLGSNIYLWGGRNDIAVCNTLYYFDTDTLRWSKPQVKGYIPMARDGHSACVINNCMYIFGGFQEQSSEFASAIYKFNFELMMWSIVLTTGIPPSCRDFHTATAIGNKMYIFGGRSDRNAPRQTDSDNYCSLMFYLDTSTGTWTSPPTHGYSPIPRRSHSAFMHNGFIYIFGGYNKNKVAHFNDINQYDPVGCTWKKIFPMGKPPSCRRRQICQVVNDRVFISGGTSPYLPYLPPSSRLRKFGHAIPIDLKDHDDLHVLDMNPSLKDMCMVSVWEKLIEMRVDHVDDLCIPLSLKLELGAFDPIKVVKNDKNLKFYVQHLNFRP